jgi:hypothetical protein
MMIVTCYELYQKEGRFVKTPVNPLLPWLNMFLVAVHYLELMEGRYMLRKVRISRSFLPKLTR